MKPKAQMHELIASYVEGRCGPDEIIALEALLLADAVNRDEFLETVLLAQDLELLRGALPIKQRKGILPVEIVLKRQRKRVVKISLLAAAAMMLLSAVALRLFQAPHSSATVASFRSASGSALKINHVSGRGASQENVLLAGSRLLLEHGVVEVKLPYDVRAVVEAPAAVTLIDDRTLQFDHGRAFFEVSSAEGRGFTVVMPQQRIVDLGTAFGLHKKFGREEVEVHVMEGRVRVDSLDGEEGEILAANRSVLLEGARIQAELDGPPFEFQRELPPQVETLLEEDFESGLLGGREYSLFMDSRAIRDSKGHHFTGITERQPWNFRTARPNIESVAFHGFGGVPSPGHITTQRDLHETIRLVHFADGADTGIDFTIHGGNGIDMRGGGETMPPAAGTPAAELFTASGIHLDSGFFRDSEHHTPGPAVFTFAHLNPQLRYDIALYGDRSSIPSDGAERFTLRGAVSAENRSSTGIKDTFVVELETRPNASSGHVVRWIQIDPGPDGAVSIEIDPSISGHTNIAYLSALRVAVTTVEGVPVDFSGQPVNSTTPGYGDAGSVETEPTAAAGSPNALDLEEDVAGMDRTAIPPKPLAWYPSQTSASAFPSAQLKLTFNKAIALGSGRIFLRNVTDWKESELAVGGPRLFVKDRVLTILPPAGLADGEVDFGGISAWECQGWVGIFNPGEDGPWYQHEDLRDKSRGRGVIGAMRGPIMATFGTALPGSAIRHELGPISDRGRYTISVAIGVRDEKSSAGQQFKGYAIRLLSGERIVAELSENTPPGRPNSVTNVGFSWDSSRLPRGVSVGDPLILEIAPNQASGNAPGYLDIDNVRVTVFRKAITPRVSDPLIQEEAR